MKNFKSNRKNVGAASIAFKACAWMLSIMLAVTGMAPSFIGKNQIRPVSGYRIGYIVRALSHDFRTDGICFRYGNCNGTCLSKN